ncbi:MAG: urea ABC transporter permease subunit UrtB [Methylophilaceae bacterium]
MINQPNISAQLGSNVKSVFLIMLLQLCIYANNSFALDTQQRFLLIEGEDNEPRIAALDKITKNADVSAIPFLQAVLDDSIKIKDKVIYQVGESSVTDVVTGKPIDLPEDAQDVVNNNQMRSEIEATIAALNLLSKDEKIRLESAKVLLGADPSQGRLALIRQQELVETVLAIKDILAQVRSSIELTSTDRLVRLAAVKELSEKPNPNNKQILSSRLEEGGETDAMVKDAIEQALKIIESKMAFYDKFGQIFTGISLGSILLLAALGLAVTYGLMGVINMAHGEMMMIGAYATYIIQNVYLHYFPNQFAWYLLVAVPFAFIVTALVGVVLERLILRHLYGRPLETLLATWGVSLILMQLVRTFFGAQNVSVENPAWMSGGVQIAANLILPYNRIFIIVFAMLVLLAMWLMISKTRLGLFIRAVTLNRGMASCVGVNTSKVDALAFGLGSGIAGLAGVALSQIGNVGPALGQSYIVDSFMVVVLGGVGQLAGAVYAALGLGVLSKFLEGIAGAVLAKIFVLVIIIIFIQKRPQGLFAFKGRSLE